MSFLKSLTGSNVDTLVSDAFAAPIGDLTQKDPNWAHDNRVLRYRPLIKLFTSQKLFGLFGTVLIFSLLVQWGSGPVHALEKTTVGGDFTLTDHNGDKFELKQQRGKLVLIFFGYTFCPDICPSELSSLAKVLRSLGNDADKVSALFVSVDPKRDTPEKLKSYVPFFSPELIRPNRQCK